MQGPDEKRGLLGRTAGFFGRDHFVSRLHDDLITYPSCPAEVPGIHDFEFRKTWMAGTSPAMTALKIGYVLMEKRSKEVPDELDKKSRPSK